MNSDELKKRICRIFDDKEEFPSDWDYAVSVATGGKNPHISIRYGHEYISPDLTFAMLSQLGELFGTNEINFDDYDVQGCETCGYGGDHGRKITIYKPTKLKKELFALASSNWSSGQYREQEIEVPNE
jgi:hypothetical protein